jgi:hypothetical protein
MKPSIGRIVIYHFMDSRGVAEECPAIITKVTGEYRVNLYVFFEPSDHRQPYCWNVDACHADPLRAATPDTWSWPPRV